VYHREIVRGTLFAALPFGSYLVAIRRKFFNRLISRSMMLRCRYASRSKSGWRRSWSGSPG
jgi:hypothetical protein